LAIEKGAVGC